MVVVVLVAAVVVALLVVVVVAVVAAAWCCWCRCRCRWLLRPLQPGLPAASVAAGFLSLLILVPCCRTTIFWLFEASFCSPSPIVALLPLPNGCSSSQASSAAQAATFLAFRSFLVPFPPPFHCSPAFLQHLLPFPCGRSSSQAPRRGAQAKNCSFSKLLGSLPPAPPHCSPAFQQILASFPAPKFQVSAFRSFVLHPASPLHPGLPAASAAAASLWLLILESFSCCRAEIFGF